MKYFLFLITLLTLSGCKQYNVLDSKPININNLLDAHNQERSKQGLPELKLNLYLTKSAQKHAEWMAQHNKLSHTGANRSNPFERMHAEGYVGGNLAENIAYGAISVEKVMSMWMESRGHRRNILGDYQDIGFGVATSENGTIYFCVDFGK